MRHKLVVQTKRRTYVFWKELDEMLQQIRDTDHVIIAGHMNGHIGASSEEFECWHGGNGYGQLN